MAGPTRKNPLRLDHVLIKLIERLEKTGVINVDDIEALKEKVIKNLTDILGPGNLPNGELLKNPRMIMKLTLCIVAAHTLDKKDNKQKQSLSFTLQIFKTNNGAQLKKLLQELITELENNPALGNANNFRLLLRFLLKEALEEQKRAQDNAQNNPNEEDLRFLFLCVVIGGVVVDVLEGVLGTKKEEIFTLEEMLMMCAPPAELEKIIASPKELENILTFGTGALDDMLNLQMTPTLNPR